jgi:hypothetical protein
VIGVVDHPAREPEHLALKLGQIGKARIGHDSADISRRFVG